MWNLPGAGIKPVSPALQGRFLTTGPPAKPWFTQFYRKKERLYFYLCPIPKPMCVLKSTMIFTFKALFPHVHCCSYSRGLCWWKGRSWQDPLSGKGSISSDKIGRHPGRLSGIWKVNMIDDKLLSLRQTPLRGGRGSQGEVSSPGHSCPW